MKSFPLSYIDWCEFFIIWALRQLFDDVAQEDC